MLIFGYEKFLDNGLPITNGYDADFKNNISPINLGWAGYVTSPDIKDYELMQNKGNMIFPTHIELADVFCNIKISNVDEINEKYYYPVDIMTYDFFNAPEAHNIKICDKVVNDIKSNKCKILVMFIRECLHSWNNLNSIINSWIEKYDLPINSVVVSSGNYWQKRLLSDNIISIPFSVWEKQMKYLFLEHAAKEKLLDYIKSRPHRDKLFLCYNRRPRQHRVEFVNELYKNGLLSDGYISLREDVDKNIKRKYDKEFIDMLPLSFDNTRNLHINYSTDLELNDYKRTFFSVITETTNDEGEFFVSEKIFKPIISMHPFFVVSCKGFLKGMRDLGYKTFSEWIDESYDDYEDPIVRNKIIVKELLRFKSMRQEELNDIIINMIPVLKYNQDFYARRVIGKEYQLKLEEIL
jgi:hypothetical protein